MDLAPDAKQDEQAKALFDEIDSAEREQQIAFRHQNRYVASIESQLKALEAAGTSVTIIKADISNADQATTFTGDYSCSRRCRIW